MIKYKRDPYSKGWLAVIGIAMAGLLFFLGINTFTPGIVRFQFNWIGILWFVMGGLILIRHLLLISNKSKLRKIVLFEFEMNPHITVEKISSNTGIAVEDVSLIILDLKTNGKLRGNFSFGTGEAKSMEVITQEQLLNQKTGGYCPYCGTPISSEEAAFCQYCGTKL